MSNKLRATYRLQIQPEFTLAQATEILSYVADLGISHVYTSPLLAAAPGSTHGYDVVDPTVVNAEIGGSAGLERFHAALQKAGLGHVLDIVPNHMAITGAENPWWWDVLENGPASRYATYFDVEWNPPEARHENQVLVPVLGDHYGRVLENGDIRLGYDGEHFTLRYFENRYPVDPRSLHRIVYAAAQDNGSDTLAFLADAYRRLPLSTASDRSSARRRYRDQAVLGRLLHELSLERPSVRGAIDRAVAAINTDPDALDEFLSEQNYRLAFWRITQGELGYRRFFDINTLIGLRMEDEQVYADTHTLIHGWLAEGRIDGLRLDHPDGLFDPGQYFERLHNDAPDTWVVIEKILEGDEPLPADWPVAGTTGYDFLNRVNGLFVDQKAEEPLTRLYEEFSGEMADYTELVREKKLLVMREILGSDVARLTALFRRVCARHRRQRDYTEGQLRECIYEVAAALPVYRTYVRPEEGEVPARDVVYIDEAIAEAKAHRPDLGDDLFDFFRDLLMLRTTGDVEAELVRRFQQFTGPAMAKGVEDTTFYVYNRFLSLNEVGGNPGDFGLSVDEFHAANTEIAAHWPRTMLASSTHDTKRSEDVRARLNVISEIPERWAEAVTRWAEQNQSHKTGGLPDRNTQYLLYQNMVGAWPIDAERMKTYMEKATREAKVHTSWTDPDPDYAACVADFIDAIYADANFVEDVERFVSEIRSAGYVNSLAQTLIKFTAPGIPDIYQGNDLWDFSLVDPDNRRPVDYAQRRQLLQEMGSLEAEAIWACADEGLPKLWVTRQALALRQEHPALFDAEAGYEALEIDSPSVVGFRRGEGLITLVPRLTLSQPIERAVSIEIPQGTWRNLLTGETVDGGALDVGAQFARFPVCLLHKEDA